MRDRSSWKKALVEQLERDTALVEHVRQLGYDATDEDRHVRRLARLIPDVELGLTLLSDLEPDGAADDVRWLLSGYRYPVASLASERSWAKVQRARMYLVRRKGRSWRPALEEYLAVPIQLRCFDCTDAHSLPRRLSSGGANTRVDLYRNALEHSPPHQPLQPKWAPAGRLYARVRREDETPLVVPIDLPQDLLDRLPLGPYVPTRQDRGDQNPPIEVAWCDLREAAREMDQHADEPYYADALDRFVIKVRDIEGGTYTESDILRLDGLQHIVGLVNVGKTTILKILAFWLAKNQKRVAFVVSDVVTAVRLASEFAFQYKLKAAPVLGARDRRSHLEKVFKALMADCGDELHKGAEHPAQRWFSPLCPLLALIKSEERWAYGDEPCENLYKTPEGAERRGGADEDGKNRSQAYTCPLYPVCPRHQLERDVAEADVWFLTRSSLVQTRTPPAGFPVELFFGEAVYRDCHVLLVDEADKIQVELDEAFAPDEVLVDRSQDSFLNRIGDEVVRRYRSARSSMRGSRYSAWQTAESAAQAATNMIYRLLLTRPHLRDWLGLSPFTGRSLFSRIARDLAHDPNEKVAHISGRAERQAARISRITQQSTATRKRIEHLMAVFREYLEAPLYFEDRHSPMAASLSSLVATLLLSEDEKRARTDLHRWTEQWSKAYRPYIRDWPTSQEQWDKLLDQLHFALLLSVLDNRLAYLVDHLSEVKPILDLDDTGTNLVHRPPLDYLAVLPEAPVGNILGFQYIPGERTEKYSGPPQGGKLVYFRFVGVGRHLLLSFPTLFTVDGRQGPHTILTSGTSVAPGSPAYHIVEPPVAILAPRQPAEVLAETRCTLLPQIRQDHDGAQPLRVSGLSGDHRRNALAEIAKRLCQRDISGEIPLTRLFQKLRDLGRDHGHWSDRERILVVTGSYSEAELVADILQRYAFSLGLSGDAVAVLRSDAAAPGQEGIRRGEVSDLRHTTVRVLVAPLMALERGHNILNDRKNAAFGAVLVMVRPMPVPDNWQSIVQELNAWALRTIVSADELPAARDDDSRSGLHQIASRFYRHALAQMYNLSARPYGYRHLTVAERHALCWTQFISLWQLSARLIRGNVPAHIYFVDAVFAPVSSGLMSDPERSLDTPETSLLVGIIDALKHPFGERKPEPWEQELLNSLYGVIADSLERTEGLAHGLQDRESRSMGTDR